LGARQWACIAIPLNYENDNPPGTDQTNELF